MFAGREITSFFFQMALLDDLSETLEYYLDSFQEPEYFHDDEAYSALGLEETPEESGKSDLLVVKILTGVVS